MTVPTLNPEQFPTNRWNQTDMPEAADFHSGQGTMFNRHKLPGAEPHQQTQDEFSHDERTWFHGTTRSTKPPKTINNAIGLSGMVSSTKVNTGFHIGTAGAARDRLLDRRAERARVFTGRVTDERQLNEGRVHSDEGEGWNLGHPSEKAVMPYQNDYEDVGSTSVALGHPSQFQTHREAVTHALSEGKPVRRSTQFEYERTGGAKGPQFDPNIGWNLDEAKRQRDNGTGWQDGLTTSGRAPKVSRPKQVSPKLPMRGPGIPTTSRMPYSDASDLKTAQRQFGNRQQFARTEDRSWTEN